MTVSTTDSVVEYVSGGPAFPVPYRFLQDSDIEAVLVKQDGTTETLTGAQYTLSGAGSQNGGTLTSSYAAGFLGVAGASLTISRVMDPVQPTDLRNQGKFLAETHETVFDRLTMLIQQGFAGLSRALVRPIGKNYYDAQSRQIKNLGDPAENQDATTKSWVQDLIASILATGQGPINNSANVIFAGANGFIGVVQDLANKLDPQKGSRMLGHDGWTVGDHLAALKFPGQFASLSDWAASGGNLGIVVGTYPVTEQLSFPHGTVLHTFGAVTLDFSAVTSAAAFPDLTCVKFGDLSRTLLPKLASAAKGDLNLGFVDVHGLAPGDTFAIWNPTDSSFAPGHRTAYHEGEFCRVARVTSTTQVVLQAPLASSYVAANVDVYKTPPRSVTIKGSLKVRSSDTLTSLRAVRAMQLMDCDISGLRAISPIGTSAFEMRQCFKVSGKGVSAEQWALSGTGTDYGIIHSGCQDIQIEGFFAASRHAITTGGYGGVCDVVNRNIQMKGTASTTFQGGVPAVNTHGNTEYFSFEGLSYGGITLAGNFSTVRGTILGGPNGVCVEFGELSGHDHDLSGCIMRSIGNPGAVSRGIIDLGGNTEPSLAGTVGGTLNFRGVRIIAPNSTRALVLRQRVSTATDICIDIRDVSIEKLAGSSLSLAVDAPSGSEFATLSRHGFVDNTAATQSVSRVTEIKGAELADNKVFNITAGASSPLTVPVNYPAGMFGGIAPVVSCSISSAVNGTKGLCYAAANQTSAGFIATIATADGSPFASSASVTFGYECKSKK